MLDSALAFEIFFAFLFVSLFVFYMYTAFNFEYCHKAASQDYIKIRILILNCNSIENVSLKEQARSQKKKSDTQKKP